jgi:hypothetical protein
MMAATDIDELRLVSEYRRFREAAAHVLACVDCAEVADGCDYYRSRWVEGPDADGWLALR